VHKDHDLKPGQPVQLAESLTFTAPDFDDTRVHLWNYFEAVRTRKPVVEDVVFATMRRWRVTWRTRRTSGAAA